MTTQPQHGDRRIIRAATDDCYWLQEYDAYARFWRSIKLTHHADEREVTPITEAATPDLNEQARRIALAHTYSAISILIEAPGNHADALTALDAVLVALSPRGNDYAAYVAIEQEQPS